MYTHIMENLTMIPITEPTHNESLVEQTPGCDLYVFIMNTIVMGSFCITGLIGNITAFLVFWKDKVKTSTSFLFQGLSFVDTIFMILAIPVYSIPEFVKFTGLLQSYDFIAPYILVYCFPLCSMAQTATIWLTVLVGVNRYIAVCKPYQASRLCTVNQAKKQLTLVVVCSVLYNVPKFAEGEIDYQIRKELNNRTVPIPAGTALLRNDYYQIIYLNACYMLFMLILPLLILTVLNIRLIKSLNEIRQRRAEMQSQRQQQDNNVTLVLIIVVLVFSICQAPALVTQILWTVLDNSSRKCGGFQFYYSCISNALVILNSAVNFFIYFFFNKRFKQVLIENLCCTCSSSCKNCKTMCCNRKNVAYSNVTTTNTATAITATTAVQNNTNNHHTTTKVVDDTNETLL